MTKIPKKCHQKVVRDKIKKQEGIPTGLENLKVRNAQVKPVSYDIAKKVILKYEYLGTMANTTYHYAIFYGNKIAGVCCFGNSLAGNAYVHRMFGINKKNMWVLARGACVHWAPKNTNSKLIGQSLKLLKKDNPTAKAVIAYSDPKAGEIGTVYQATNWTYIGQGRSRTCVIDNGKLIHSRYFSQKGGVKAMKEYVKNNPGSKILWEKDRIKKHRYVFFLADKREKKKIKKKLKKKIKTDYPKRSK